MTKMFLVDDGTLDTVFECEKCSHQERYSEIERDCYGDVTPEEMTRVEKEHAENCSACE